MPEKGPKWYIWVKNSILVYFGPPGAEENFFSFWVILAVSPAGVPQKLWGGCDAPPPLLLYFSILPNVAWGGKLTGPGRENQSSPGYIGLGGSGNRTPRIGLRNCVASVFARG